MCVLFPRRREIAEQERRERIRLLREREERENLLRERQRLEMERQKLERERLERERLERERIRIEQVQFQTKFVTHIFLITTSHSSPVELQLMQRNGFTFNKSPVNISSVTVKTVLQLLQWKNYDRLKHFLESRF